MKCLLQRFPETIYGKISLLPILHKNVVIRKYLFTYCKLYIVHYFITYVTSAINLQQSTHTTSARPRRSSFNSQNSITMFDSYFKLAGSALEVQLRTHPAMVVYFNLFRISLYSPIPYMWVLFPVYSVTYITFFTKISEFIDCIFGNKMYNLLLACFVK